MYGRRIDAVSAGARRPADARADKTCCRVLDAEAWRGQERRMAQGRRKLIAGNWKMNGLHQEGLALARELSHRSVAAHRASGDHLACDLLICPPATLLITLAE